ncbi:hypothetical protein [Tissierella sp. Yu-01]|uniref:hypothetical protein n=1 Tax=Tissierella sp. Yu-01 TaxID=3035694 RepID=UPI00240D8DA7|nr:hypothetical protein [Tissierella sp. Yu-01]WFA10319.1 hypothetical protein P3962_07145 [Tissierella sp. Yu-01]
MKKFENTIYSDNLHNYDYDELVESYNIKDTGKNDKNDVSDNSTTEGLSKIKSGCRR